jgi:hypothetical protein
MFDQYYYSKNIQSDDKNIYLTNKSFGVDEIGLNYRNNSNSISHILIISSDTIRFIDHPHANIIGVDII